MGKVPGNNPAGSNPEAHSMEQQKEYALWLQYRKNRDPKSREASIKQ
jgi:hypothetical protein